MGNRERHHAIRWIIRIMAVAGMCWQIYVLSDVFFKYNVVTGLDMRLPDVVETDVVTMCTRYTDVLDFTRINRDKNLNWTFTQDMATVRSYQDSMTIADVLKYSPREPEVLMGCKYRPKAPRITMLEIYDNRQVNQLFNVTKFLNQEHVCFQFWMRENVAHDSDFLNASPIGPGMVFTVYFEKSNLISRSHIVKILITKQAQGLPFNSIDFAVEIRRGYDMRRKRAEYNFYSINKVEVSVRLLPPPYVSDCFNYTKAGYQSQAHCLQSCLKEKTLKAWDKVPFSALVNESSRHKMISYNDLKDQAFMLKLMRMEHECLEQKCRRKACHEEVSLTVPIFKGGPRFLILFTTPAQFSMFVGTSAILALVEYISCVMGIVGTYSGICIASLNPDHLMRKFKRFLRKTSCTRS